MGSTKCGDVSNIQPDRRMSTSSDSDQEKELKEIVDQLKKQLEEIRKENLELRTKLKNRDGIKLKQLENEIEEGLHLKTAGNQETAMEKSAMTESDSGFINIVLNLDVSGSGFSLMFRRWATRKTAGSAKNGHDSKPKNLGVK
ncbi:hypothetical protein RJ639_018422 [Escallonia herrerae]|uniref:Uncharacterized protein n=1 Tax=Escallonia herrerae TaxID=1293975 RepID=A0AA88V907_9ASTE|nr:hypothetical protein RJ639_018422 [Escallonia herrerae]